MRCCGSILSRTFRARRHFSTLNMAPVLPLDRRPVVISGPSGVGKGTLVRMLSDRHPGVFTFSVSHTTRSPRPGETNGVEYHFTTKDAFLELKTKNGFVETAQFGDNFYGTSKAAIEERAAKGKVVVLDIEMEGVKQIRANGMPARFVFIAPPSADELEHRLRGRGTEKEDSIRKRLDQSIREMEYATNNPGVHDRVVVNDDLERAYAELDEFIFAAPDA